MKLKKLGLIMLVGMVGLSLVSCGSKADGDIEELKTEDEPAVIEEQKEVVVGTSVAVVEILDKLGVKVSGVPESSYELPESAKDATRVGNPMNPDMEIIKSLNPDVVIATDTLGDDYESLFKSNNIPSLFVNLDSVDGLKETVKKLAERFNKLEKDEEILAELDEKEKSLKEVASGKGEKNVMIAFAAPGGVSMLATDESYVGNLVKMVGAKNIVSDTTGPFVSYSNETLAKMNPDMILVMTHALPEQTQKEFAETIKTDTAWKNIGAVKEGKVVYLDSSKFGMSANLKVIDSLDELSKIIFE